MSQAIVSVDLHASFGFLKKPDTNEGIYLTYNCLHKPALLGILGAIVGLDGYTQSYPAQPRYLRELSNVKVGIQPPKENKGNIQKTVISYNNSVGYANLDGGTLIVHEQTLLNPSFTLYVLLDDSNPVEALLRQRLEKGEAEFIPYFGKNDHQLWWDNYREYRCEVFQPKGPYSISTLFRKDRVLKSIRSSSPGRISFSARPIGSDFFMFFERLPVGFDERIKNYRLEEFVFTNRTFPPEEVFEGLYLLRETQAVVQLL